MMKDTMRNTDLRDHADHPDHPVTNSGISATQSLEKEAGAADAPQHLENIRTVSRVPANSHYFEKDGLRTYGDNEDHDHEPPVSDVLFSSLGITG